MALGIIKKQQWEERITAATLKKQWGDMETIVTKLIEDVSWSGWGM